ncbi:hypothetical protein CDD82_6843 [Ophiocordyceps australis]|uniref:Uncharacterized protein n=1 Tax=Ophiocordyceps australis TaxID=1399860 RepID=A0A2C5ZQQ9_9HYPO|nr:hypothetical protein CDD82_6843 [Ophiocordyceps australis]
MSRNFDLTPPLAETTQAQLQTFEEPEVVYLPLANSLIAPLLLHHVLGGKPNAWFWKQQVARSRCPKAHILLLQMFLRHEESCGWRSIRVQEQLPTQGEWDIVLDRLKTNGCLETLRECHHVISGSTDDEKCQRLVEMKTRAPWFLVNYVLRSSAKIESVSTLNSLIQASCSFCNITYGGSEIYLFPRPTPGLRRKPRADNRRFLAVMQLLAYQCGRVEPRLIVELSKVAARYIADLSVRGGEKRRFQNQGLLFNSLLKLFRRPSKTLPVHNLAPNAYFWEAQRIQLAESSRLEKPLLINLAGFRHLREVLAGQEKDGTESRSSIRHAPTWPPYLQDIDGSDEDTDSQDNWSRTIRAGMLMQEAGFEKEEQDYALDVLQGMASDGSPTIQQRNLLRNRPPRPWEASIKATRNIEEAWQRFQNPPSRGSLPGLEEYAAMFEKMVMREAGPDDQVLPGDKALTFAPHHEASLTDFERARRKAPSLEQLYSKMLRQGLEPSGLCLRILVSHAQDLATAHKYLNDSYEGRQALEYLLSGDVDKVDHSKISSSLFAAYVKVAMEPEEKSAGARVVRLVRLASRREGDNCRWTAHTWRIFLKKLWWNYKSVGMSYAQSLELLQTCAERVEYYCGPMVSTLIQFSKSTRKATARRLKRLTANCKLVGYRAEDPWQLLSRYPEDPRIPDPDTATRPTLDKAVDGMQAMFTRLVEREAQVGRILGQDEVKPLDYMACRNDPVRSEHAFEYLMSLAVVGRYNEMVKVLLWLAQQWSQDEVAQALSNLDEIPPYADFTDVVCGFRLVASPMLEDHVNESVQRVVSSTGAGWAWPDDATVLAWADSHDAVDYPYMGTLRDLMDMKRHC